MARVKRTLTAIKNMTEEERGAVKELIASDEKFKKATEEIKKIFASHFCFDEDEIELFISNICEGMDEQLVSTLQDVYEEFVKNDITGFDREERRELARGLVDNTLIVFAKENNALKEEFISVLREAKALKVDPFKLAIKTNIQSANLEKFQSSLEALMVEKYYGPKGEYRELFTEGETRAALERCASIAYDVNAETLQQIMNVLNDLMFDKQTNSFVYDPRSLIKDVPSLLLAKPKDIENAIEMLKLCNDYKMDKALLKRIKASPSLLLVHPNIISNVNKVLTEEIEKLVNKKPYAERTKAEKNPHSFAVELSDKFTLDINHLTQIEKMKPENFGNISAILEHYLGIDNAVTCMQNMNVLSSDPSMLEFMLATLVREETNSNLPLRDYFVLNPYPFLAKAQQEQNIGGNGGEEDGITIERTKKKEIVVKKLPEISLTDEEYLRLQNKVNKTNRGLTIKNLAKIKEIEEEKRKEAARQEKERAEEEKRNLEALRAARREEKKAKKEKKKGRSTTQAPIVASAPQKPEKTEPSLEEKQALRRSKLVFPQHQDVPVEKALEEYFLPIIDGFIKNGYYYKSPSLSSVTSSLKTYLAYKNPIEGIYEQITDLRDRMINILYDRKAETSPTWLKDLFTVQPNNKTTIENLMENISLLMDVSDKKHDVLKLASSQLIKSGNSRELRVFNPIVSTSYPSVLQANELINNYDEYIQAVNKEAAAFYCVADIEAKFAEETKDLSEDARANLQIEGSKREGDTSETTRPVVKTIDKLEYLIQNNLVEDVNYFLDDIIPEENKKLLEKVKEEISTLPEVTEFIGLELMIYISPILKKIFDLLQKRGILKVDTFKNIRRDSRTNKAKLLNPFEDIELDLPEGKLTFSNGELPQDDTMIVAISEDKCHDLGIDANLLHKFGDVYNALKAHTEKTVGNLDPVFKTKQAKEKGYDSAAKLLFADKKEFEEFVDLFLTCVYKSEDESE